MQSAGQMYIWFTRFLRSGSGSFFIRGNIPRTPCGLFAFPTFFESPGPAGRLMATSCPTLTPATNLGCLPPKHILSVNSTYARRKVL